MGSLTERYIDAASTYAHDIDGLIFIIALLVGFWGILAEVILLGLVIAFRERPGVKAQYITGDEKHQKAWVAYPHYLVLVCDVFIIVAAVRVWYNVKQELPPADETVRVVAQQWAWTFVHPGKDKKFDTADDIAVNDELHIAVGKVYHYYLESRDVLHSFSIPVFRIKQDAIPGREITGWFEATKTGTHDIQCVEMCGIGHGLMPARVIIETPAEHEAWLSQHQAALTTTAAR